MKNKIVVVWGLVLVLMILVTDAIQYFIGQNGFEGVILGYFLRGRLILVGRLFTFLSTKTAFIISLSVLLCFLAMMYSYPLLKSLGLYTLIG